MDDIWSDASSELTRAYTQEECLRFRDMLCFFRERVDAVYIYGVNPLSKPCTN
jgi:hypothetical protein